jgi:hypothetical protein
MNEKSLEYFFKERNFTILAVKFEVGKNNIGSKNGYLLV